MMGEGWGASVAAAGWIFGVGTNNSVFVCDWELATAVRTIPEAGERAHGRPLAVVPPGPGKRVSHLVVSTADTAELLILALPDFALVHTHTLRGMMVRAIAADPWGEALAVSDAVSHAIHVMAWPLPGMPVLE